MFIDKTEIYVKAGNGGNGCVAFHREKYVAEGGHSGGDGGHGGNVVFEVDTGENTLLPFRYKHKFVARNGEDGKPEKFHGKTADDLIIKVPQGTLIRDADSGKLLYDMGEDGRFIAAKGGRGGFGNVHFATPTRQIPRFAKGGTTGEERRLILELKMLADVGLIGFPNVGKSTLLSMVSAAKPKIANYHFTTLSPILGVVKVDTSSFVMADIPGLIEGASEGAGLGHDFLRHVDRCRLLVHVVDAAGTEGRDPVDDIEKINRELTGWSEELSSRPQIIVANKCDVGVPDENRERLEEYARENGIEIFFISAVIKSSLYFWLYTIVFAIVLLFFIVKCEKKDNYVLYKLIAIGVDAVLIIPSIFCDKIVTCLFTMEFLDNMLYYSTLMFVSEIFIPPISNWITTLLFDRYKCSE